MFSELSDGIYIVNSIKNGKQVRKIGERVSELPEALNLAKFEQVVYPISKELNKFLSNKKETYTTGLSNFVTTKEVIDLIRVCIKKQKN